MTLHVYEDLEQGSDEWLAARRGIVTASEVGTIITASTAKPANNMQSRSYAAQVAAERINGWTADGYYGPHMERGHEDEPVAINAYTAHKKVAAHVAGFMARDDWGFRIGYSPDALVGTDGCVEAKSREPKKHIQTVLADQVPAENMAQCQAALLVSGRAWCDYVSYCGGMRLWVKRVHPDPKWQAAIVEAVTQFEAAVEQMVATYHARTEGFPMTERTPTYEEITF